MVLAFAALMCMDVFGNKMTKSDFDEVIMKPTFSENASKS